MKNIFHRKKWIAAAVEQHVDPPPTPLIKIKNNDKLEKNFVKLKLRRDLTSAKSNLYELKMSLFNNVYTEVVFCPFIT